MTVQKKLIALVTCLFLINGTLCQAAPGKQPLTLESIFAGSEFENILPQNIQWQNDERSFTFTR